MKIVKYYLNKLEFRIMSDLFRKEYKSLSDYQKESIDKIKDKAQELWDEIECTQGTDPRMIALAKTNLEQAVMWAIKAIT
jgi:hypothetical protein